MKKICLVLPSLAGGGMERVMVELSKHFSRKPETEVHFVLLGKSKMFYQIREEIKLYEPDFTYNDKNRIIHTLRTLFYFRKTIKKLNPDAILSFGEIWNNFVLLALLRLNFPVFVSDRCNPQKSLGFFHDNLRKLLYKKATGVIAQTEKAKQIFDEMRLHTKIKVIGNPVRDTYNPQIKSEKIVLSVGRLIKSKNFDRLIEIFDKINDPEWQLIIIGGDIKGGDNLRKFGEFAKTLKNAERIKLPGQMPNVEEYYNRASIFAFMSVSEGFPNVIGEAMSANLPIVAYDCIAGPSDLIHDGINGFLIPEKNEDLFQRKLNLLMKDDELREHFGRNSRNLIGNFSVSEISDKFYDLLIGNN